MGPMETCTVLRFSLYYLCKKMEISVYNELIPFKTKPVKYTFTSLSFHSLSEPFTYVIILKINSLVTIFLTLKVNVNIWQSYQAQEDYKYRLSTDTNIW